MPTRLPGPRSPVEIAGFLRAFGRHPYRAMDDLHRRHGDVIAFGPSFRPFMVFLVGPEANELILARGAGHFRWHEAFKMLEVVDGPTALVVTDGPEHDRRRRLVQPAFHKRRIDGYVGLMVAEADRVIDALAPGTTVDAFAAFGPAVRRIVVQALFGAHLHSRADAIGDLLQPALDFVNRPPLRQLHVPLPGTAYHRAQAARRATDAVVDAELARRRAAGDEDGGDVLAMLLAARDEAGRPLSPAEVRDQVISLIAAGYDTTSATLAWAVRRLAAEPDAWKALRAEVAEVLGGRPPAADDLPRLRYLDGAVQETLRLHPAGVIAGRKAAEPFEVLGRRIPAGPLVAYSPYLTQRDPRWWDQPGAFRPERWDKAAPGYVEPLPYSMVTFGGGARRCLGFAFALVELKVLLARLAQRVDLDAAGAEPVPGGVGAIHPRDGVPVRVLTRD